MTNEAVSQLIVNLRQTPHDFGQYLARHESEQMSGILLTIM